VKALVFVAMILCGTRLAMAEDAAPRPAKAIKAGRSSPLRLVPLHSPPTQPPTPPPPSPPTAVPEQFSPPQEAYASFPDRAGAAATAGPSMPTACQLRLAKLAVFKQLPALIGAGECGAVDAVLSRA
jgi:hypothetical protein